MEWFLFPLVCMIPLHFKSICISVTRAPWHLVAHWHIWHFLSFCHLALFEVISLFLIWFFECYSWSSQCYSSTSQMEPGVMGSWLLSVPLNWSQCPVPFSLSLVSLTLCQKCWLKSALWILMLICDAPWFFYMFAQLTESSSTVFPAEMRYLGIK